MLATLAFLTMPTAVAGPFPAAPPGVPGDPTPDAPNAVHAAYDVRLRPALDGFDVTVKLSVHEIELAAGRSLPAASIRALPSKDVFEEAVQQQITRELGDAFAGADVRMGRFAFDYGATATGADAYHPAVRVAADADVRFTASYLGMSTLGQATAAEAARALLYSGGSYLVQQDLRVEPGMSVRLSVHVPQTMEVRGNGAAAQAVTVASDNWANATARSMPIAFTIRLSDGHVPENVLRGPLVEVLFDVTDRTSTAKQALPFSKGDFVGRLDLRIEVPSLEARFFEERPLPASVAMDQVSADVLRVAFDAGLVAPEDVARFFEALVTRNLKDAFGNATEVVFDREVFAASVRQPVGGADGRTVAPLVVAASSAVPVSVKDEWVSSNMVRGLGMLVSTRESFTMENRGSWDLAYTVVYPHSLHVEGRDTEGLLENLQVDGRDAVRIYLPAGQSTTVTVTGKASMDVVVLGIQAAELALLLVGLVLGTRTVRRRVAARRGGTSPAGA